MNDTLQRWWPLLAASALYLAMTAALGFRGASLAEGRFVYALDDAYIHMSLARNLAFHGTWGVSPDRFASCASSILHPLLVAGGFKLIGGANELVPLALNVAGALALLFAASAFFSRAGMKPLWEFCALAALAFVPMLPSLALSGMEHSMHAAASVLFLGLAAEASLSPGERPKGWKSGALLVLAAALTVCSRYEGLFQVAAACLLLALRGRFGFAVLLGALGALAPVGIFGAISVSNGWHWLPNSVIIKSQLQTESFAVAAVDSIGIGALEHLARAPHVLAPLLASLLLLFALENRAEKGSWSAARALLAMHALCALQHMQFSRTFSNLCRYEAYILAQGVFVLALGLKEWRAGLPETPKFPGRTLLARGALAGAGLLIAWPMLQPPAKTLPKAPGAMANMFQQQWQMGRFLREHYAGEPVAVSDLGLTTFLGGIDPLDLVGLGDMDAANLIRAGEYEPGNIDALLRRRNIRVVVTHADMGRLLAGPGWFECARWTIEHNVASHAPTVVFYALEPAEAELLSVRLKEFGPSLPKGVRAEVFEPQKEGAPGDGAMSPEASG